MKKVKWKKIKERLSREGYTDIQLDNIEDRIYSEINKLEVRYGRLLFIYNIISLFSFISGVFVSAFITISKINNIGTAVSDGFFWTSFTFSVINILIHKLIFGFNLSKKILIYSKLKEKIKSELWKFINKIERYNNTTPENAVHKLFTKFEKIKSQLDKATLNVGNTDKANSSHSSHSESSPNLLRSTPIVKYKSKINEWISKEGDNMKNRHDDSALSV